MWSFDRTRRMLSFICAVCVAAGCGLAWYVLLTRRYRHATKFDLGHLTEMEELQLPIADTAFYMSYFYDVVRAPSVAVGLRRLLADERSEAPDVINAVQKFNIFPEIAVAALHHTMKLGASWSSLSWPSPFTVYVRSVFAWSGLGISALAMTAWSLGGGLLTAPAACSMFFSLCFAPTMSTGVRIFSVHSLALREHWGTPALLLQNGCLTAWLQKPESRLWACAYLFCTCIFEVCWQFAPFVLVLQMCSLLAAHLLAGLPRVQVGQVASVAVLGTIAALVVSFGNRMLLCSPFFALALSMAAIGHIPGRVMTVPTGSFMEASVVLIFALGCGAFTQRLLVWAASEQEDSHVLQLLLQKLGFAPENSSFDAFLYLQAAEFGFIQADHVWECVNSGSLPAAAVSCLLILLAALRSMLSCSRSQQASAAAGTKGKSKKAKATKLPQGQGASGGQADSGLNAPLAALVSQASLLLALTALACLVNRLRVLAAPVLCVMASMLASPRLWASFLPKLSSLFIAHLLGLLLVAAPPYMIGGMVRSITVGEHVFDADMLELVEWVNSSLPDGALVMADMTMAAKFRLISPKLRVGNHPQYESLTSRQRNKAYYRTFTCAPPERVHEVLSNYSVTHVLLNSNACRARIGKLDAFHEAEDWCGKVSQGELQAKSFCWGGFLSQGPTHFRLAFRNAIYTVLELQQRIPDSSPRQRYPASGGRVHSVEAWTPWLEGLQSGKSAARGLAHAAAKWPRIYGSTDVALAMLRKAEELQPNDAIIQLQKATMQQQGVRVDASSAVSAASQLAFAADDPSDLLEVFEMHKQSLMQRGPQQGLHTLQAYVEHLKSYLVASRRSFELCDIGGWLSHWGQRRVGQPLWDAAKGISLYDQCVREDWTKWEKQPLPPLWRAFLI